MFVGEHSCDALHANRKVEKGRAQASCAAGSYDLNLHVCNLVASRKVAFSVQLV